jgi:hypothetical protein
MKLKLNVKLVEIQRRRAGLKKGELANLLGFRSRQGYWDMIKRGSTTKVDKLAKLFDLDKKMLVVIE